MAQGLQYYRARLRTETEQKPATWRCEMKANLLIVLAGVVYAYFAMNILVTNSVMLAAVINTL
jgi:hypothetical protein